MKIYPKTSLQDMSEEMNEINRNSEGMELQFFHEKILQINSILKV